MRTWMLVALLGVVALAGCADNQPDNQALDSDGDGITDADELAAGTDPFTPNAPAPAAQAVVAVIDSNTNPYHEFFQRATPIAPAILASFVDHNGVSVETVQLTAQGTYEERREADAEFWDNIQSGQLYHFLGTSLLGVSFGGNILEGGTHGIGTTAAVLNANPDAIVILVQGVGGNDGEQWAMQAPFVDILSESYGLYCGQQALELAPGPSTAKNNKVAWENGKVPVGAADNTPCPAMNDGTSGPPWVVGVSGDHPQGEGQCREPVSGNFPDFTADFTQTLPYGLYLEGNSTVSGTSFATPTTAGAYSRALLQVREAWGHEGGITDGALAISPDGERLTNIGLRDAFNQTAQYFSLAAVCSETGSVPVNPAAPWVQMGWGHVDGDTGGRAADHILGVEVAPARPDAAVLYMETVYTYRQETWNVVT